MRTTDEIAAEMVREGFFGRDVPRGGRPTPSGASVRDGLARIADEVAGLTAKAEAGEIGAAEFAAEVRRLGVERDALLAQLPPPSPPGARLVAALGAFCAAYLEYREVK